MLNRPRFLQGGALLGAGVAGAGCASGPPQEDYAQAVDRIWRHSADPLPDGEARQLELVRYACLAPSSHNTQCWKFRVGAAGISLSPDFTRRCPVVDPDDHHLFVSLGCAAENLVQAAAALGWRAALRYDEGAPEPTLVFSLEPAATSRSPLFEAIPARQSTRTEYDGKPLARDELALLERAGSGPGVRVVLLTERALLERVLELVIAGNTAQMRDPAFVAELVDWIRFSDREALVTGDGLHGRATGNPNLPRWLGERLLPLVFTEGAENDKYARHLRSAAGLAVFVSAADDLRHRVEAGRAFQRFALQATVLGVRSAHLNQPVEVPALRGELAALPGIGPGRPNLVVRFGRGPEMPRSLRRPVAAVLG